MSVCRTYNSCAFFFGIVNALICRYIIPIILIINTISVTYSAEQPLNPHNSIQIRNDRVFILNGKPFFPIMVNNELGPDNYRCQLRKPDGSSWGFNIINLMTQVTWHFKKFGGYCPDNPDLDYCGTGYRIRDIISGDASTSQQYHEILSPMGYDIDWYSNANRIFNYLDNDMYVLADDYAFYPSTVDWFEQNGGCTYPSCIADCDSIYPRFDQTTRIASVDRIDSLTRLSNSKIIGFYGLDDPTMLHSKYRANNSQIFQNIYPQQANDLKQTYNYVKTTVPNSIVVFNMDVLYYPKASDPGNPEWQDWSHVLNKWVDDEKQIVNSADVLLSVFYDASIWNSAWWLYPDEDKAMWYPNHIEQTIFPRLVNQANKPFAIIGGLVFDDPNLAPNQPFQDQKMKWVSYIGLQKGATGLYYFGWHKGNETLILNSIWTSVKNLVDTLVNVKHLDTAVFTKSNVGSFGHSISGSTNQNVSYAAYQTSGWNDYYLLVSNNPNGKINDPPEPDNMVTISSSVSSLKADQITEIFSGNRINADESGSIHYNFPCWGVALFHIVSGSSGSSSIPASFYLSQNYPNPFNPSTKINFGVPQNSNVKISVYNSVGQEVAVPVNSYYTAGNYSADFFGNGFPSGIYFYRMTSGSYSESRKMVFVK